MGTCQTEAIIITKQFAFLSFIFHLSYLIWEMFYINRIKLKLSWQPLGEN